MGATRRGDWSMPPDVFAFVMATGIVSVAAGDQHYRWVSDALGGLATGSFLGLGIAWAGYLVARRGDVVADFRDPDTALRMFTLVAAGGVLSIVWAHQRLVLVAASLLVVASWLALMPLAVRDVRSRPSADLRDHAHGAWLLVSVGTSALATVAADWAIADRRVWPIPVGLTAWGVAAVMYVLVAYLIGWRAVARPFGPDSITPDAWILMGALAIAALAGGHLTRAAMTLLPGSPTAHAVEIVAVLVWVAATAWIPLLVVAQLWRINRVPGSLRFAIVWWSAIFPLGMYASATAAIGDDFAGAVLHPLARLMTWIALAAWAVTAVGGLRRAAGIAARLARAR